MRGHLWPLSFSFLHPTSSNLLISLQPRSHQVNDDHSHGSIDLSRIYYLPFWVLHSQPSGRQCQILAIKLARRKEKRIMLIAEGRQSGIETGHGVTVEMDHAGKQSDSKWFFSVEERRGNLGQTKWMSMRRGAGADSNSLGEVTIDLRYRVFAWAVQRKCMSFGFVFWHCSISRRIG